MRIPLPCKFGETFEYKGKSLKLLSVSWFKWSYKGLEFTYTTDKEFVTNIDMGQPEHMEISDEMVKSCQIKGLGYPLKGIGYVAGIQFREGRLFADIIVESRYLIHILCECDGDGKYKKNGEIQFPPIPSFETDEKRKAAVLKQFYNVPFGTIKL